LQRRWSAEGSEPPTTQELDDLLLEDDLTRLGQRLPVDEPREKARATRPAVRRK